ncbi:MAG: hypothetical protein U0931_42115 [Vulcanimicrobiota bacterium]
MSWYYRYETKGIQNWILSSNKLRDLAGGSALVEELTQAARERALALKDTTVVQATSGSMTAIFSTTENLERFVADWPMMVSYLAPGLQMIHAWVEEKEGLPALFQRLAARRNEVYLDEMELNPWVLRSGRSGLPAVPAPKKNAAALERRGTLDRVVLAKEWARSRVFKSENIVTGGRLWQDFEDRLEQWQGPVAIVHADGSGIGEQLMKLGNKSGELQAFSEALMTACRHAIARAVDTLPVENGLILARPIVAAGDDLTYIVPAAHARRFAETWLIEFEAKTDELKEQLGGSKLHGGAGIAIVGRSYPFSQAYELSERLCKEAKTKLKTRKQKSSVLAFRRLTTSLDDAKLEGPAAWLVDSQHGTQPLVDLVSAVRDLPRGTLRTWLDHFTRPEQQDVHARQLWSRAQEVARQENWERFSRALAAVGADPESGGFRKETTVAIPLEENKATPLVDALTLRFIEKGN